MRVFGVARPHPESRMIGLALSRHHRPALAHEPAADRYLCRAVGAVAVPARRARRESSRRFERVALFALHGVCRRHPQRNAGRARRPLRRCLARAPLACQARSRFDGRRSRQPLARCRRADAAGREFHDAGKSPGRRAATASPSAASCRTASSRAISNDNCATERMKLCPYRNALPATGDKFLWGQSVFDRLGRFDGLGEEMRHIVLRSLAAYPGQHLPRRSVRASSS